MRLEVVDRSNKESIATYIASEISMLGFLEWKDVTEVVIPLDQLVAKVTSLNTVDPVTDLPSIVAAAVDFYLPGPLRDRMLERLAKRQTDASADSSLFSDSLQEVTDQVSTPPLRVSTILLAITEELLRNHLPNDAYEVKISDE